MVFQPCRSQTKTLFDQSQSRTAARGVSLGSNYPRPIVQHDEARAKTLARYAVVKSRSLPD